MSNTNKFATLYFKDAKGTIKRLDKASMEIYMTVVKHFTKGKGKEEYIKLNAGVKNIRKLKPLELYANAEILAELESLAGIMPYLEIYTIPSRNPLVKLYKKPY